MQLKEFHLSSLLVTELSFITYLDTRKYASYVEGGNISLTESIALNLFMYDFFNLIMYSSVCIQLIWSRLNDLSFLTINTMISMSVPGIV